MDRTRYGETHRALADSLATIDLLEAMRGVSMRAPDPAETFIQRAERELLAVHPEERTATPW